MEFIVGRMERISDIVRKYDRLLYCDRDREGKLCIYRQSHRTESYTIDGHLIHFVRPTPYFVFALTDNWKTQGRPVEWGLEPIVARLRALDLWQRDLAEECIQSTERNTLSKERDRRNSMEGFLHEFRNDFKRTFNDTLVHSLEKKDRKRKDEKWQS